MLPVLITDRLILRPAAPTDAADITRLLGDFDVAGRLARVPWPYERYHAEAWIERSRGQTEEISLVIDRHGPMGGVGLRNLGGVPEMGYWLGKPHWGRGYASEAAFAMLAHAFDVLGYETVLSGYFDGNGASARVLEKLGFTITGKDRRHCLAQGRELAHTHVALTRADFEKMAP